MHFTPEQAREMAEVGPETLRHWRKAVPYLATRKGKAARFTFGEIVGLAVLSKIASCFGVQVSIFGTGISEMFFALCRHQNLNAPDLYVRLATDEARVIKGEETLRDQGNPTILISLTPIIERLNRTILPTFAVAPQRALEFSPETIRRQA